MPSLPLLAPLVAGMSLCIGVGDQTSAPNPRRTPVVEAIAKARPSVVALRVDKGDDYGGVRGTTGTGVIADSRGFIVTARHVITAAHGIRVLFEDGTELPAHVLATEPSTDLAILRVSPAHALPPLEVGSASDLMVGEPVVVIGHPHGYRYTASAGIVSAVGRRIPMPAGELLSDVIQVDASVNPGMSGGPLLNANGEWIGVAVATRDGAQGMAFAVNADTVRALLDRHLGRD